MIRNGLRLCVVLAAICAPAEAQTRVTTADVTGLVRDATGSPLANAVVTATNVGTNLRQDARSDAAGRFTIVALPPGAYAVDAALAGFRSRALERPVTLAIGSVVDLEFVLTAAADEAVFVEGRAPLVDPARTVVSGVVSRPQIDGLPINRRDVLSFAVITPAVSRDNTPQQGSAATSGLSVLGQRGRSNSLLVDGLDSNDSTVGGFRSVLPQDAVAEFQVLASSYSAEVGKASGGVVNVVTRSGTNVTSGRGFFLFRDETLNAKEHFERFDPEGRGIDRDKAPYGQKQFGASLGGPLQRDRSFYFAGIERTDIQANNFVTINDRDPVSLFGVPVGTPAEILRRAGFPVETGHVPYAVRENKLLVRVDQQLRSGNGFHVRAGWATADDENSEPWGGQVARSRGGALLSKDATVAGGHGVVLSNRVLNEFRSQIVYHDQNVIPLDPNCNGRCERDDQGGPTLELAGIASVGRHRFLPQPRKTRRYEVLDTLSLQHRGGALRSGVDYNAIDHLSGSVPLHFGGRYIFAPLPAIPGVLPAPVSSIQAFALGLPAAYVQGYGNPASAYLVQDASLFAQEEWNVARNLTLKAGARYQVQLWPDIKYAAPGLDPYTFPSDPNIAPRLAAAWTRRTERSLSIHAAYGRFYDNHLTSLSGVTDIVDGTASGVRTLVVRFPASVASWNAPGHRLPESAVGPFPSVAITVDPKLRTPYANQTSIGVNQELTPSLAWSADFIYVRGHDQVGTLDYNPILPELGPDRRPGDLVRNGVAVAGSSASLLQYTSYGQTWYRGLAVSFERRFNGRSQWLASYTLSKAEDNSTDYQNAFLPEDTGKGRDPRNPTGLPIGFDPLRDRGPSLQDQRHRFVGSGIFVLPGRVQLSTIVTIASGHPYNIAAGVDLNGDGNGGAFPPDRARRVPGDPSSSVVRNSGRLPAYATTDLRLSRSFRRGAWSGETLIEAFNLFNRTNFTEINSVFGAGAYPISPLPTFGQFEKAGPPLQVQIGFRVGR